VPQRLEYYRQQSELACQQAEREGSDREGWLRIADEWQKLHDALARDLGLPRET
jgi:hypothetical protein